MKRFLILLTFLLFIVPVFPDSFDEAVNMIKNKEFSKAQKVLEDLNTKFPDDVYILNNLGVVFLEKNQYNRAERCFKKALGIRKDFRSAFMNLGILYYYREDWYTLIKHSFEGKRYFPQDKDIIDLILAYSYYRIRDFNKAKEIFKLVDKRRLKNKQLELYQHLENKLRLIAN